MAKQSTVHISLGSNQGKRLTFLKTALHYLEQEVGIILSVSSVYESPAWGFESAPFLNACVSIKTDLPPAAVLQQLLCIETKMGRSRSKEKGYKPRTIDLDILFYNHETIATANLKIPHPQLHLRNFVLYPLAEIAAEWEHPVLKKTIQKLLETSEDTVIPKKYPYDVWTPSNIFEHFPYIAMEGNIGVGKTTLGLKMSQHYDLAFHQESFLNNPYLQAFYKAPKENAANAEHFFLEDRVEKTLRFWEAQNSNQAVADHSMYRSLVFAAQNLDVPDFVKFQETFEEKTKPLRTPDLVIYLRRPVSELLSHIQKRRRSFEHIITPAYLEKIQKGYDAFFEKEHPFVVLTVNATNRNYISNEQDFQGLLRHIDQLRFGEKIP